jgi:uncharacterized protein (TIGR03067 family)
MKPTLLLLFFAATYSAVDDKDDPIKREQAKLEGTWSFVEITGGSKKIAADDLKDRRMVFKGNTVAMTAKGEVYAKGTYTVDPKKSPATMTTEITVVKEADKFTIPAIYELKDDSLKLCEPQGPDGPRPKEFEATENTVLATLKREKP